MRRLKFLLLGLAGALVIAAGVGAGLLYLRPAPPPQPIAIDAGFVFEHPLPLKDFKLVDQDGRTFDRQRLRGHWTFVYFGYTYCPDACPLALSDLNQLQKQLVAQGLDDKAAYLLISVDPQRDTPARLGEYVHYFNPRFQGATGSAEELAALARQLGVVYYINEPEGQNVSDYTVDHSSTIILIGPDAELHAVFTPPHDPAVMEADFARIIGHDDGRS